MAAEEPKTATVLYAYDAAQGDELSIKENETVRLLAPPDNGWVLVQAVANGKRGLVPENYISMTKTAAAPASVTAIRAKVIYEYTAQKDDELSIEVDQIVDVLYQNADGWWEVKYGPSKGLVPAAYVELIQ
jgi:hypothetical protein